MHAFSLALVELYQRAEQTPPEDFPAEVLRILRQWIGFDGAVLGMGESIVDPVTNLHITQAHIDGRDPSILEDYGRVSAHDPVTARFLQGLDTPLSVDCVAAYREVAELREFCARHQLRHLMLFGDQPTEGSAGRWLVLYRAGDMPFTAGDAEIVHAAWLHVSRAIGINRAAILQRVAPQRARQASALLDQAGRIESADANFLALLRQEWPGFEGRQAPAALRAALVATQAFKGRQIEVQAEPHEGYYVCNARGVGALAQLAPGEAEVARRFAAGLSYKEIARELGVSPNTVRSQIASLYGKLGVHDKASLAQLVSSH